MTESVQNIARKQLQPPLILVIPPFIFTAHPSQGCLSPPHFKLEYLSPKGHEHKYHPQIPLQVSVHHRHTSSCTLRPCGEARRTDALTAYPQARGWCPFRMSTIPILDTRHMVEAFDALRCVFGIATCRKANIVDYLPALSQPGQPAVVKISKSCQTRDRWLQVDNVQNGAYNYVYIGPHIILFWSYFVMRELNSYRYNAIVIYFV